VPGIEFSPNLHRFVAFPLFRVRVFSIGNGINPTPVGEQDNLRFRRFDARIILDRSGEIRQRGRLVVAAQGDVVQAGRRSRGTESMADVARIFSPEKRTKSPASSLPSSSSAIFSRSHFFNRPTSVCAIQPGNMMQSRWLPTPCRD